MRMRRKNFSEDRNKAYRDVIRRLGFPEYTEFGEDATFSKKLSERDHAGEKAGDA